MDQPVLQRAPPVHSGGPPCRAAWGAREAAQACQHGSSRDRTMWQLCCLSTLWVSGTSIGGLLRFYNFSGTCCNALRVLQERWHPVLSRTVLQSVSRANLFFECHTTTALVLWQMQPHYLDGSFFLHVAQLCGYHKVRRWLRPYNGWMHLPYETRGVLPRFISMFSVMTWLEAAPWPLCFRDVIPVPPLVGGWRLLTNGFLIAADSQEDDYSVHEGLWRADLSGLWEFLVVDLRSCTACLMLE